MECWNRGEALRMALSLYELLAFLEVKEAGKEEDYYGGKQYYPVIAYYVRPGCLANIIGDCEGIEKDVPLACLQGILQCKKEESKHDHQYGPSVPVLDYGRQHQCHNTQKENRIEHMVGNGKNGHLYNKVRREG